MDDCHESGRPNSHDAASRYRPASRASLVFEGQPAHLRAMNSRDASFLDGQLLIAMPGMGDLRFERSVIFMCAHSAEGAMGLIVNKPAPELSFADLLAQLKIPSSVDLRSTRVHFGGPVEHGRGFVLHSSEYQLAESSLTVTEDFAMTATVDILQDMARGEGPHRALLALGYAGWGPGQLEGEIQANGWLTAPADAALIFDVQDTDKWGAALRSISIDPRLLSTEGGRA
jgi:putative transcriptional regulator